MSCDDDISILTSQSASLYEYEWNIFLSVNKASTRHQITKYSTLDTPQPLLSCTINIAWIKLTTTLFTSWHYHHHITLIPHLLTLSFLSVWLPLLFIFIIFTGYFAFITDRKWISALCFGGTWKDIMVFHSLYPKKTWLPC